jgi:hypothetical protein
LEDFDSASVYKGGGKYRLYSPAETVERAKSRVGESRYNLVTNNCEHFSVWCKTGIHQSYQVNRILQLLEHLDEPRTAFVIGG